MKTRRVALLLTAAAFTSCGSYHTTGSLTVSAEKAKRLLVEANEPTRVVLELWNDGPDAVNFVRHGGDETRAPLTKGGTYRYEYSDTERIDIDLATTGNARVRYEVRADRGVMVSMSDK